MTKKTGKLSLNSFFLDLDEGLVLAGQDDGEESEEKERPSLTGVLCAPGAIRNAANRKTALYVTAAALSDAQQRGLFDDLACFVDHASWTGSTGTMFRLAGVWGDSKDTDAGITGKLYFYDNEPGRFAAETFNSIQADAAAGRPVPDVGVSIDFYGDFDVQDEGTYLTRIEHIRCGDLVFMPASPNARIHGAFASDFTLEGGDMPKQIRNQIIADGDDEEVMGVTGVVGATLEVTIEEEIDLGRDQDEALNRFDAQAARLEQLHARALTREVQSLIANSGLPQGVRETLSTRKYGNVEDVEQAIADAQAMWSSLIENDVVRMGGVGGGRAGSGGRIELKTGLDHAKDIANWLFGVPDSPTPEPRMRRLSEWYRGMTGDLEISGRFNAEHVLFAGANTSELANITEDALNKVLVIQWEEQGMYRWYEWITEVIPNDGSLHDIKMSQIGSEGSMPTIAEGGAFTEGTIDDKKEESSFVNKGKFIGITRKAVKNDDVDAIRRIPVLIAQDAVFARSDAVSALFTAASGVGPTLQDTNPLFHSSRGNVATTAFSEAAWEAAALECAQQERFLNSRILGIMPKYALVPVALWYTARKAFGYGDGVPTTYSPFAFKYSEDDPRPIPLAVPNWTDANDWAYAVDPKMQRHICMSYSSAPQGGTHPRPEIAVLTSGDYTFFNDKVAAVRVMDEAAVGVADAVGLGKRNVA